MQLNWRCSKPELKYESFDFFLVRETEREGALTHFSETFTILKALYNPLFCSFNLLSNIPFYPVKSYYPAFFSLLLHLFESILFQLKYEIFCFTF